MVSILTVTADSGVMPLTYSAQFCELLGSQPFTCRKAEAQRGDVQGPPADRVAQQGSA